LYSILVVTKAQAEQLCRRRRNFVENVPENAPHFPM